MTEPIPKFADQLVVGDRIRPEFIPYTRGPAEAVFVKAYAYRLTSWVFVAYRQTDGLYESTTYLADKRLMVHPADTGLDYSRPADSDDPQPSAGREPMHTGGMTEGGLVDETEVRCATSDPHAAHRTTFAPEMGIPNGRCPGVADPVLGHLPLRPRAIDDHYPEPEYRIPGGEDLRVVWGGNEDDEPTGEVR